MFKKLKSFVLQVMGLIFSIGGAGSQRQGLRPGSRAVSDAGSPSCVRNQGGGVTDFI